jgi:RNA polymerase sigma factor (sigma-70 family)
MLVTMSERPASSQGATGSVSALGATAGSSSSANRRMAELPDEVELLRQAKRGSSSAFDLLVSVHQEKIAGLVHRLLGWPSDVDDVVQDVFVDVLKNLHRFDGRSSVVTWLTRIAINRCRSHQRKQWLRIGFLRKLHGHPPAVTSPSEADPLATAETIQQVHTAIRKLNQRDREIIVLRYLEELPVEEIANTLGLSRGAADVRLTRARQKLEQILKPLI